MRTNLILAGIAAALAVPTYCTIEAERATFTVYDDVPRLFDGFNPETIARIDIHQVKRDDKGEIVKGRNDKPESEMLRLQKAGGNWVMGQGSKIVGAPVKEDSVVTHVLQHMEQIRRDEDALIEVNASDEKLEEFELTEETGMFIECYDAQNRPVAMLVKGKSAHDAKAGQSAVRGHFVRVKDRKDVILYEQDYWKVLFDNNQWIERVVIPREDVAKIVSMRIKNAHGETEFYKDKAADVAWKLKEGPEGVGAVRQQEVNAKISQIARATVMQYLQPLPRGPRAAMTLQQLGLSAPENSAVIKLEDGTEHTISIGSKMTDKNEHHAQFSKLPFVVTVADWVKKPFEFDPLDLFDPSAESVQPKDDQPKDDKAPKEDGNK